MALAGHVTRDTNGDYFSSLGEDVPEILLCCFAMHIEDVDLALLSLGAMSLLLCPRVGELHLQLELAFLQRLALQLDRGDGGFPIAEGHVAKATLCVELEAGKADAVDFSVILE